MTVKFRDVYHELSANWLKEGSLVYRVCHVEQREHEHQVFLSINLSNFILLSVWIIRISSVGVKTELNGLRIVLEASAQLACESLIEIGRFEKGISGRILSIDLKRFALCRAINRFLY